MKFLYTNAAAVTGEIAEISLLVIAGEPVMTTLAIIGMVAGLVIVAWLPNSDLSVNPDAPRKGPVG